MKKEHITLTEAEWCRRHMKTRYLIGGTIGVGKTTVGQYLKYDLPRKENDHGYL